jgi:hypothetical protein
MGCSSECYRTDKYRCISIPWLKCLADHHHLIDLDLETARTGKWEDQASVSALEDRMENPS